MPKKSARFIVCFSSPPKDLYQKQSDFDPQVVQRMFSPFFTLISQLPRMKQFSSYVSVLLALEAKAKISLFRLQRNDRLFSFGIQFGVRSKHLCVNPPIISLFSSSARNKRSFLLSIFVWKSTAFISGKSQTFLHQVNLKSIFRKQFLSLSSIYYGCSSKLQYSSMLILLVDYQNSTSSMDDRGMISDGLAFQLSCVDQLRVWNSQVSVVDALSCLMDIQDYGKAVGRSIFLVRASIISNSLSFLLFMSCVSRFQDSSI